MSARDQSEAITVIKSLGNVLSKSVSSTPRRDAPAAPIVGIGPEQVAHGPLVRHLLKTVQSANVVQSVDAGTQAAVQAENLSVHQSCQWQVVK